MTRSKSRQAELLPEFDLIGGLPPLPDKFKYIDEYNDEVRVILSDHDIWVLNFDTHEVSLDFLHFPNDLKHLFKSVIGWHLQRVSPSTSARYYESFRKFYKSQGANFFRHAMSLSPLEWTAFWEERIAPAVDVDSATALKAILHFTCGMSIAGWGPGYRGFVRSLPYAWPEGKSRVTTGMVFVSVEEERSLIEHFDKRSAEIVAGKVIPDRDVMVSCLLCLSYEHGLRPVQIGRADREDFREYRGEDGEPVIHFAFHHAKKRNGAARLLEWRRIKRSWAPLFAEYRKRLDAGLSSACGLLASASEKMFPIAVADIGRMIAQGTETLTGVRRPANDLRHSAAQRLVDAGATVAEVAHFLGHSYEDTALIYFEFSNTSAERLNKALAISPVFTRIDKIIQSRFIDADDLSKSPANNQVGGMPHGIPIAGIGACNLGQSLCIWNPVTSCYGCRKFIPVNDLAMHQGVLAKLREIVRFFFDESRGNHQSRSFVQLRLTIEAVLVVITEIENEIRIQEHA